MYVYPVHVLSAEITLHKRSLKPLQSLVYGLRRYDLDRAIALAVSADPNANATNTKGFMSHQAKVYLAGSVSSFLRPGCGLKLIGYLRCSRPFGIRDGFDGDVPDHHGEPHWIQLQRASSSSPSFPSSLMFLGLGPTPIIDPVVRHERDDAKAHAGDDHLLPIDIPHILLRDELHGHAVHRRV